MNKRKRYTYFPKGLDDFVLKVQAENGYKSYSDAIFQIVVTVRKFHSSKIRRFLLEEAELRGTNGEMETALDIVRDAMKKRDVERLMKSSFMELINEKANKEVITNASTTD